MNKSGFKYLKLTAVAAVLAITLIGLSGLLSATTIAQEKRTLPDREIDLRAKLKDKKFADGRRVVIDTLDSGEKIVAEVKAGDFLNWFLVTADETEVKAEVKIRRRNTTTTTTVDQQQGGGEEEDEKEDEEAAVHGKSPFRFSHACYQCPDPALWQELADRK